MEELSVNENTTPDQASHDSVDMKTLKESCPAFMEGCPFAKMGDKQILEELKSLNEFHDGCVFKNASNLKDLHEKLEQMNQGSEKEETSKLLLEAIKHVHQVSQSMKSEMGQCPVFAGSQGCPFKTVCSDGKLLLEKLEFKQWAQMIQSSAREVIRDVEDDLGILLSKELKEGTKKIHREAEHSQFMKDIIRAKVNKDVYKTFVVNLYFIYKALEEEGALLGEHELFGQIAFPDELNRLDALCQDLEYYFGSNWEGSVKPSKAAQKYIERIHTVASEDPTLLIPHHYTRYLGDLSGGQILKKKVIKGMSLPDGKGTNFYEFEKIPDPVEFKKLYRTTLDKLDVSKEVADKIVEEANTAFALNIELFAELDELSLAFKETTPDEQPGPSSEPSVAPTTPSKPMVSQKNQDASGVPIVMVFIMALFSVLVGYLIGFSQK